LNDKGNVNKGIPKNKNGHSWKYLALSFSLNKKILKVKPLNKGHHPVDYA